MMDRLGAAAIQTKSKAFIMTTAWTVGGRGNPRGHKFAFARGGWQSKAERSSKERFVLGSESKGREVIKCKKCLFKESCA